MNPNEDSGQLVGSNQPTIKGRKLPEKIKRIRLSIKEYVSFQPPDSKGTVITLYSGRWLDTEEQPYVRHLKIGPEWQRLDLGWLAEIPISLLVLHNEIQEPQIVQTEEGKAEQIRNTLEVALLPQFSEQEQQKRTMLSPPQNILQPLVLCLIKPSCKLTLHDPINPQQLIVRSIGDQVKCTLYVLPSSRE